MTLAQAAFIDGLSWAQVTGIISLVITATLALVSLRKSIREAKDDRKQRLISTVGADVQRDSVAVGSTERAVLVLDNALQTLQRQYDRDTTSQQAVLDRARVIHERELTTARETLDRTRASLRRSQDMQAACEDRLSVRDEVIRDLNDRVTVLAYELGQQAPRRLIVRKTDDKPVEVDSRREEAAQSFCPDSPDEVDEEPHPGSVHPVNDEGGPGVD